MPSTNRINTQTEVDSALSDLALHKDAWAATTAAQHLPLLDELHTSLSGVVERWVTISARKKGIRPGDSGDTEDWAFGSLLFRQLNILRKVFTEIARDGRPQLPGDLTTTRDGRVVAKVFPKLGRDRFLYTGLSGEVWFNPGVTPDMVRDGMAQTYRNPPEGRISLVLGAGNVSSLLPGDFLHKLFVEKQVVLLKMNPVNEYLGELVNEGYAPLVRRGVLRVVYGGVPEVQYMVNHAQVDELHMTGSDATHDAIVFGSGEDGKRRKRERTPIVTKRFTSELGNISPVIIVPGEWGEKDVVRQARALASRLIANAGFNCLTPRLIIQHKEWQYRDLFNRTIHETLAKIPTRCAYYPNADKRHAAFIAAHPNAAQYGKAENGHLPWTFIQDVNPDDRDDIVFTMEPFCSLFAETALSASNAEDFVTKAANFANERLWGTLVATLIMHPSTDKAAQSAVEDAVAALRYGSVGVNVFGELAYLTLCTPWGGHSGSEMFDVQSGIGFVNNPYMFDESHIQKSVLRTNFHSPLNLLDPFNTKMGKALEKIAEFEQQPSLFTAFSLVRAMV